MKLSRDEALKLYIKNGKHDFSFSEQRRMEIKKSNARKYVLNEPFWVREIYADERRERFLLSLVK